jgi:hypothetical protein
LVLAIRFGPLRGAARLAEIFRADAFRADAFRAVTFRFVVFRALLTAATARFLVAFLTARPRRAAVFLAVDRDRLAPARLLADLRPERRAALRLAIAVILSLTLTVTDK